MMTTDDVCKRINYIEDVICEYELDILERKRIIANCMYDFVLSNQISDEIDELAAAISRLQKEINELRIKYL